MKQVQDMLDFKIDTPSDKELVEQFKDELELSAHEFFGNKKRDKRKAAVFHTPKYKKQKLAKNR